MKNLPSTSNLFARADSSAPEAIARLLEQAGFHLRKAGFTEFEIIDDTFEIIIEGASPVLIHGPSEFPEKTANTLAQIFVSLASHLNLRSMTAKAI